MVSFSQQIRNTNNTNNSNCYAVKIFAANKLHKEQRATEQTAL